MKFGMAGVPCRIYKQSNSEIRSEPEWNFLAITLTIAAKAHIHIHIFTNKHTNVHKLNVINLVHYTNVPLIVT